MYEEQLGRTSHLPVDLVVEAFAVPEVGAVIEDFRGGTGGDERESEWSDKLHLHDYKKSDNGDQ